MPVSPNAAAGTCPSEDQLFAHAQGSGSPQELDQLLRHLDGCASCRYLLAETSRSLPAGVPAVRLHAFDPGDLVLDRFRIERFLGQSTIGELYLARDQLLVEAVAMRALAGAALDDPQAAFRFRAEARLARLVTHPNVCRILEFGLHIRRPAGGRPESVPFYTMEFLAGETVAARLARRGRLREPEAAPVILQAIAGLQAIHASGIVHGDFKSENVFLVQKSRVERARVTDFGLTRPLDLAPLPDGAIDTMAPEQIEGRPSEPTVDVFAFGVFLFELLTGRRPFVNVPVLERLSARAPFPSSLAPLSPGWDAIIGRCLERNPAARFQNLSELGAALGRVLRPSFER